MLMTAKNFSLLAAVIFAIVAILQLARALSGAPITIGTTFSVPVWGKLDCLYHCLGAGVDRF
jgi:hypothetical protein